MKCCRWTIGWVIAVSLFLVFPGCATNGPKAPPQTQDYGRVKGYTIKLGEFKAGSFETPPYIPKKILFELELDLRQKQLLASEGDKKALTVNVTSSTRYMFFRNEQAGSYSELTSLVEVVDTNQPEIIAKTTLYSYNAWRNSTSDFTEIDHARSITKFLERIVR
jgi:hypothetical protein